MFKKEKNKFFFVSKRARAAYLILCLEEALKFYDKENLEKWKWLLVELWKITSTCDIDGWVARICDASSETVISYSSYQERIEYNKRVGSWYTLDEKEFDSLHKLYSDDRPFFPTVYALYDKILNVIALDWGEPETAYSPLCLPEIEDAEKILSEHSIPFPQNSSAISYIMQHKDKYYGPTFDGYKFSILSNNF